MEAELEKAKGRVTIRCDLQTGCNTEVKSTVDVTESGQVEIEGRGMDKGHGTAVETYDGQWEEKVMYEGEDGGTVYGQWKC